MYGQIERIDFNYHGLHLPSLWNAREGLLSGNKKKITYELERRYACGDYKIYSR